MLWILCLLQRRWNIQLSWGFENRDINNNVKDITFRDSNFLINKDKECESETEANKKGQHNRKFS